MYVMIRLVEEWWVLWKVGRALRRKTRTKTLYVYSNLVMGMLDRDIVMAKSMTIQQVEMSV
jgi:hypothetical protein